MTEWVLIAVLWQPATGQWEESKEPISVHLSPLACSKAAEQFIYAYETKAKEPGFVVFGKCRPRG